MTNPRIAFDESGHTGQDLLNSAQPVFTLASVHLSDLETANAMKILGPQSGQEPKFKNLKRSKSGQHNITSLLYSQYITPNSAKTYMVDKSYMVTGKIVDLLIEPLAHRDGVDLYKKGANIALADLHHILMPATFGEKAFNSFQRSFIRMVRKNDSASVRAFYEFSRVLFNSCRDYRYQKFLAPIILSQRIIHEVLDAADVPSMLDPAFTSLVVHCTAWGSYFGQAFDLLYDKSKPIEREQEFLSFLMAKDEPEVEVGYGDRKAIFPLKATGITFSDSKVMLQISIADVVAGATAYWGAGLLGINIDRDFWNDLNESPLKSLLIGGIWPSDSSDWKKLAAQESNGINMVDYLSDLIERQQKKKHPKCS